MFEWFKKFLPGGKKAYEVNKKPVQRYVEQQSDEDEYLEEAPAAVFTATRSLDQASPNKYPQNNIAAGEKEDKLNVSVSSNNTHPKESVLAHVCLAVADKDQSPAPSTPPLSPVGLNADSVKLVVTDSDGEDEYLDASMDSPMKLQKEEAVEQRKEKEQVAKAVEQRKEQEVKAMEQRKEEDQMEVEQGKEDDWVEVARGGMMNTCFDKDVAAREEEKQKKHQNVDKAEKRLERDEEKYSDEEKEDEEFDQDAYNDKIDKKRGITRAIHLPTLHDVIGGPVEITGRIALWEGGDITKLRIDCIQNAANNRLGGGGGVDGAIHRAAGHAALQKECRKYNGCPTGKTVITPSCGITHVKRIAHTVGPMCYSSRPSQGERKALLSCYETTLRVALKNECRSVAMCCVSTGIYGYDNAAAARLVCEWAWKTLEEDTDSKIQLLVFCLFMPQDRKCYNSFFKQLVDNDGQLQHSEYQKAKKEQGKEKEQGVEVEQGMEVEQGEEMEQVEEGDEVEEEQGEKMENDKAEPETDDEERRSKADSDSDASTGPRKGKRRAAPHSRPESALQPPKRTNSVSD